MKRNDILKNYIINIDALITYGFILEDNQYVYHKELFDDLEIRISIGEDIDIIVYDNNFKEIYQPFEIRHNPGNYISKIQTYVDGCINDIIQKCCILDKMKDKIINHAINKYHIKPDQPFEKDQITQCLRTDKGKWYALFMTIPYEKIDQDKDGSIEIMNIKCDPDRINSLIDNIHFFRAYHMNKKLWLTVVLDRNLDLELVLELVDSSYQLVSKC